MTIEQELEKELEWKKDKEGIWIRVSTGRAANAWEVELLESLLSARHEVERMRISLAEQAEDFRKAKADIYAQNAELKKERDDLFHGLSCAIIHRDELKKEVERLTRRPTTTQCNLDTARTIDESGGTADDCKPEKEDKHDNTKA